MEEDKAGSNPRQSHVVQAGPNPEPMHKDFIAIVYPQVHEILKLTTKEHIHIKNPPSSSGTLPSMKNLDDAFTFALSSKVYTLENHDLYSKIDKYVNEVVKEVVHNALQAPIRDRFRDLSEFEMKEILHDRMFESGSYRSHLEHTALYDALKSSMDRENREEFNEEMDKSRKRRRDDQDPSPPPPKDSDQSKNKRHDSDASALKQPQVQKSSAWKTSCTREAPSISSKQNAAHLLKIKTRPDWLKPLLEEETDALAKTYKDPEEFNLLQKTRDIGSFIKWYCKQIGKSKLVIADLEGDKERRNALSISKLKAAYYPDFGLEEVELYGYTFLKEIVLRRADYKEYKILEADFKNLHLNDFKDLYLLHLQGKLNHLSGADKVNLFNTVNLWIRNIVIRQRVEYLQLEDCTIVHKLSAVICRDSNNQKKMTTDTKVHKFSDGTLMRILEKLDFMVKDFELFKFNPSMEHRIWSEDDKRRSQEFIKLIERRLKIRRIFRSLESFVSRRLRDVDYRLIQRT
ncbi:hypothetical protein Tco_0987138 [Tanacetum coccineum]